MSIFTRRSFRKRGQHAPVPPEADRTTLVATGALPRRVRPAPPPAAEPGAFPAAPAAVTEAFAPAPPWQPGRDFAPPPALRPDYRPVRDYRPPAAPLTDPAPPAPAPGLLWDYRNLHLFRDALAAGSWPLARIGARGTGPSVPAPDYGLDRFTVPPEPEREDVALADGAWQRAENGFYEARRVFHSADTAGFPAVRS